MKSAFTLIEILIVVILLGILAAVVVPQFVDSADSVNLGKAKTDISTLNSVVEHYRVSNGAYPTGTVYATAAGVLSTANFIQDAPEAPDGYTYSYASGKFSYAEAE
ncbi:MAG: prepilin-type N-terminal cleavage/methylation domain-containing protein [Phycisphaerae bacterium]|nr:prepilin-type N-terminal cleavage/methylation domain-containing protein [Phycisphaerae bacterium]